jgi:hypothetical protein
MHVRAGAILRAMSSDEYESIVEDVFEMILWVACPCKAVPGYVPIDAFSNKSSRGMTLYREQK